MDPFTPASPAFQPHVFMLHILPARHLALPCSHLHSGSLSPRRPPLPSHGGAALLFPRGVPLPPSLPSISGDTFPACLGLSRGLGQHSRWKTRGRADSSWGTASTPSVLGSIPRRGRAGSPLRLQLPLHRPLRFLLRLPAPVTLSPSSIPPALDGAGGFFQLLTWRCLNLLFSFYYASNALYYMPSV